MTKIPDSFKVFSMSGGGVVVMMSQRSFILTGRFGVVVCDGKMGWWCLVGGGGDGV